ncbi:MAG: ATP-binding protein, partial [Gemmatimonadales bacterium]
LLVGTLTFSQYVLGIDLGIDGIFLPRDGHELLSGRAPGRMAAMSALSLTLAGVGLLALLADVRSSTLAILAGVAGATVGTLGGTVVVGYATGALTDLRHGVVAGMSAYESVAFLLLGWGMVGYAWQHDRPVRSLPSWLAPAVGFGGLTTALLVWKGLTSLEADRLDDRLSVEASVVRQRVAVEIDGLVKDLDRLARRAIRLPAFWDVDAQAALREGSVYAAVGWIGADGVVRRAVPTTAAPMIADIVKQGVTPVADTVRLLRYPAETVSAGLLQDGRFLALRVASCDDDSCAGDMVGFFDLAAVLQSGLSAPRREICLTITTGQLQLMADDRPECVPGRGASAYLAVGSMSWTITASPTDAMLASAGSALSAVVLGLGVIVSALLTVSLRLAQRSWGLAREVERRQVTRALETATDGLWEWELPDGPMARRGMWRGLGYGFSETDRAGWEALIHPDDSDGVRRAVDDYLRGAAESLSLEYRIRDAAGQWHWIIDRARVTERTGWGAPRRMLGIHGDVTERRRAVDQVRTSEERFRAIFDSAFQFQALLDLDGQLLLANRTALEFAGVPLDAVRGSRLWETAWWSDADDQGRARLADACRRAAEGKTIQYQDEVTGASGRRDTIEFSVKPIRTPDGAVGQLLAEGRDVTERKRAEETLRELDTLSTMGRLAARVAHEINNPLAGIQNSFMLIKDAVPPDHPYFRYVGAIGREIDRIASVTRELYGLYRAEHAHKDQTSVATAITDAVELLKQVNRAADVEIRADVAGAPAIMPFPDALIRQVVFNLVQNAVEASPPRGVVGVSADVVEDRGRQCFRLIVRDQGRGVPETLKEQVFQDFYSTKSGLRTGGMGLGLSIVRSSVRALGGDIDIREPDEGGAEFVVRLPINMEEAL